MNKKFLTFLSVSTFLVAANLCANPWPEDIIPDDVKIKRSSHAVVKIKWGGNVVVVTERELQDRLLYLNALGWPTNFRQ